jgi:protein tyrosine/serine phosphatase
MILPAAKKFLHDPRLGIVLLALAFFGCAAAARDAPDAGRILNFGQVNDTLFRGAQPNKDGVAGLQRLGVRTIINLRLQDDTWSGEEAVARKLGLGYVSVPLHGLSAPTDSDVARILALIESLPPPVFVHCEHGADRTGTIIACYRMQHDGWKGERAFAEAKSYGFSIFQFGMRHYLRTFSAARESFRKPAVTRRPMPDERRVVLGGLPVT